MRKIEEERGGRERSQRERKNGGRNVEREEERAVAQPVT